MTGGPGVIQSYSLMPSVAALVCAEGLWANLRLPRHRRQVGQTGRKDRRMYGTDCSLPGRGAAPQGAPRCGRAGPAWGQRWPPSHLPVWRSPSGHPAGTWCAQVLLPPATSPRAKRIMISPPWGGLGAGSVLCATQEPKVPSQHHAGSRVDAALGEEASAAPNLPGTGATIPQNSAHSTPAKQSWGQRGGARLPVHWWGSNGGAPCCSEGSLWSQSTPTPRPLSCLSFPLQGQQNLTPEGEG